ncbi:MAG TPA: ankyrin repeat domain-containing protein [Gammaproteobacteria bacterium]|jgi:ankyrin repeat protein|nr:ankyrin repeat domain-containing protein [Gammaproteobacteria bacterium]
MRPRIKNEASNNLRVNTHLPEAIVELIEIIETKGSQVIPEDLISFEMEPISFDWINNNNKLISKTELPHPDKYKNNLSLLEIAAINQAQAVLDYIFLRAKNENHFFDEINTFEWLAWCNQPAEALDEATWKLWNQPILVGPGKEIISRAAAEKAIKYGHMIALEALLAKSNDNKDDYYYSIMLACSYQSTEALKLLKKYNIPFEQLLNRIGHTWLHMYILNNNFESFKMLLPYFDVDCRTADQSTPLHYAVQLPSQLKIVAALVERGADVNAIDSQGKTPLDHAFDTSGHPIDISIFNYLIAHGATQCSPQNRFFLTQSLVNAIIQQRGEKQDSTFADAIIQSDLDRVKYLVNTHQVDINQVDEAGLLPIIHAAQEGHADMVSYFINLGANCDVTDNEGRTLAYLLQQIYQQEQLMPILQLSSDNHLVSNSDSETTTTVITNSADEQSSVKLELPLAPVFDFNQPANNGELIRRFGVNQHKRHASSSLENERVIKIEKLNEEELDNIPPSPPAFSRNNSQ